MSEYLNLILDLDKDAEVIGLDEDVPAVFHSGK